MAASIHSLVADYLDISDEKAQKLLAAMLREVKKRAYTKGVRLPEFGTFRERNGELTFEPSESLARAVNRRFEGLESEDLATAPEQEEEEEQSEGPSTITLGYQDSSWSPIDSDEGGSKESESSDESEPDTAEFQVPSAEEAADTSELQTPDAASSEQRSEADGNDRPRQERDRSTSASASPSDAGREPSRRSESETDEVDPSRADRGSRSERSQDRERSSEPSESRPSASSRDDTGDSASDDADDLYPLVEDAQDEHSEPNPSSGRDQSINEAERQSLSDIWNSETVGEMSSSEETTHSDSPSGDDGASLDFDDDFQDDVDTDAPVDEPTEIGSTPPEERETPDRPPKPAEDEKSSGARVFVTLLVLLLLGGAAWYILGQRGMVQPPRTTLSTLNTQVQSLIEDPPLLGGSESQSASETTPSTAEATSTDAGTNDQQTGANEQETQATSSTARESSSDPASSGEASPSINPDAGGFTIVVASRTNESGARSVRDTYRQRFGDQNLPVDVLPSTVDNTTRYRIGVGQFQSRSEAENVLEKFGSKLPDGAWILGL